MNPNILSEIRDFHSTKSEELRIISRKSWGVGDSLTSDQRIDLHAHERFVSEIDQIIAETSDQNSHPSH